MRELFRHSIAVLRSKRLVALHLVVNAVLLVCASFWLLIPEENVWQLLLAAVSALVLIAAFLWLHSSTLAYGADPDPEWLGLCLRPSVRKLVWMLVGLAALFWCMRYVDGWSESQWQAASYLYSKMPAFMRPTSGSTVYYESLGRGIAILFWYVLPALFLPWIAAAVAGSKLKSGLRAIVNWRYWLALAVTSFIGVYVTTTILNWTPGHKFNEMAVSLVIRLIVAYSLATAAWMFTVGVLGYFVGSPEKGTAVESTGIEKPRLSPAPEARGLFRHCLAVLSCRPLMALQLAVGIALASSSSIESLLDWVSVPSIVALSIGAVLLLVAFLWINSGTLAYAAQPTGDNFRAAFRFRFGRIGWTFLGLITLLVVTELPEMLLQIRYLANRHFGLTIRVANILAFYVMPTFLLPWVTAKVAGARFRSGWLPLRHWRYWIAMLVVIELSQSASDWALRWCRAAAVGSGRTLSPAIASATPNVVGWVLVAGLLGYFILPRETEAIDDLSREATA